MRVLVRLGVIAVIGMATTVAPASTDRGLEATVHSELRNLTANGETDTFFGACCFDDGSCCILGPIACHLLGGDFQGPGSSCDDNPCGPRQELVGACCLDDGSCCILGPFTCEHIFGGVFQGFGTWCEDDICGDEVIGACCLPSFVCVQTTEAQCNASEGIYYGDNVSCLDVCCEYLIDFKSELNGDELVNGQDIESPEEFGVGVWITSSGTHNDGAAIFDSDPAGPNSESQDQDLLVNSGNILILQANNSTQTIPGIFDTPNDSNYGGVISFQFGQKTMLESITLIDICPADTEGARITLIDDGNAERVYHIPAGWTAEGGSMVLDLTSTANQPGATAVATVTEDPGFLDNEVLTMHVEFYSSAGLDDLAFCVPTFLNVPPPK